MFSDVQRLRLAVLALVFAIVGGLALVGMIRLALSRRIPLSGPARSIYLFAIGASALSVLCFGYSFLEADWLSETHTELRTKKLPPGKRLRIVHLTDLHVDGAHRVYDELPGRVNALKPDLVVFTGDALNAAEGLPIFRKTIAALGAPLGRYAVRGNHDVWYWREQDLFGGGVATELIGPPVDVPDTPITLCGTEFNRGAEVDGCLDSRPEASTIRVVAMHTPDLIEYFAERSPDLYLAGHTHGGQVRAPLYGALVTMSTFDKKYEMGRYQVGGTTLFVSRGIGVEPNAPRIRFNCRPEIAVIDLVGE